MIRRAVKNVFGMTNVAEHSKGEKNTLRTAFKGCTMYISCVCMHDFGSIYHWKVMNVNSKEVEM